MTRSTGMTPMEETVMDMVKRHTLESLTDRRKKALQALGAAERVYVKAQDEPCLKDDHQHMAYLRSQCMEARLNFAVTIAALQVTRKLREGAARAAGLALEYETFEESRLKDREV